MAYTYLWEYHVRPDRKADFLREYGPDGAWVTLFRRAAGYVSTHLYRDRDDRWRFLTVDTWESASAHREFRRRFAAEFAKLDEACEALTVRESSLGEFDRIADDDAA